MVLDADLGELIREASRLAEMARGTGTAMPGGWVVRAGADPISAKKVPLLNKQAADLLNGVAGVLNGLQRTAHHIGASAADYSKADDEGARAIGGAGDIVTNPVGAIEPVGQRRLPPGPTVPAGGGSVDPLTFARQLHDGPGPAAATRFADSVRRFASGTYAEASGGVDRAAAAMQHWRPVGAAAAADLGQYRGFLDQLGTGLGMLADDIDSYSNAFSSAKAKHPTPEEIITARKELLDAMRSKNEARKAQALAKFQEQNTRSAETIGRYSMETNSKIPGDGGDSDKGGGEGSDQGDGQGGGTSEMMNTLAQMLPMMMSAMNSAGLGVGEDPGEYLDEDYGYEDLGYPSSLGSMSAGSVGTSAGSPGGVSIPSAKQVNGAAVGAMPTMNGASGPAAGSMLPRAPVIEPLAGNSAAAGAAARGGAPAMPYMPMSPGMGGGAGGNNERNRVVAWHPDRLMYVDDTPHTELVIGERPTIAPTVTPPTPTPATQTPTQSGGSA